MPSSRKYLGDTGLRQLWTNIQEKIEEEISEIDLSVSGVDLSNYVSYADLSNYISVSSSEDLMWDHLAEGGLFTGNLSTFGQAVINAGWNWCDYSDIYASLDDKVNSFSTSQTESETFCKQWLYKGSDSSNLLGEELPVFNLSSLSCTDTQGNEYSLPIWELLNPNGNETIITDYNYSHYIDTFPILPSDGIEITDGNGNEVSASLYTLAYNYDTNQAGILYTNGSDWTVFDHIYHRGSESYMGPPTHILEAKANNWLEPNQPSDGIEVAYWNDGYSESTNDMVYQFRTSLYNSETDRYEELHDTIITSNNLERYTSMMLESILSTQLSGYITSDNIDNYLSTQLSGYITSDNINDYLPEQGGTGQLLIAGNPSYCESLTNWSVTYISDDGNPSSLTFSDCFVGTEGNDSTGTTLIFQNYSGDGETLSGYFSTYIPDFNWSNVDHERFDLMIQDPYYSTQIIITDSNISAYLSEMGITGSGNGNNPEIYYSATNEWYLSDESRGEDRILTQDTIGISGDSTDGIYFNNHTGGTDPIGVQHWNTDFIRIDGQGIEFPSDNNESYTFFDLKANPEWSGNSQISGINFRIRARHDYVNLETYDISNNQTNYAYLPTQEEIYNILLSYNLITASQLPDAFSYLSNN